MRGTGPGLRVAAAALIALLLLPVRVQADPPPEPAPQPGLSAAEIGQRAAVGFAIGFDLLILRPLGLAATAVGAVLFVPVALVSVANGTESRREAWELFVTVPAESVFKRQLGDF